MRLTASRGDFALTKRNCIRRSHWAASQLLGNVSVAICLIWPLLLHVVDAAEPAKPTVAEPAKAVVTEPPKAAAVEPAKPTVAEPAKPTAVETPKLTVVEPAHASATKPEKSSSASSDKPRGPEPNRAPGMEPPAAPSAERERAPGESPIRTHRMGPPGMPSTAPLGAAGDERPDMSGTESERPSRRFGWSRSRPEGAPTSGENGRPFSREGGPSFSREGGPSFSREGGPSFSREGGPSFSREGGPSFSREGGRPFSRAGGPPAAAGKLKFNFRFQPWIDVLNWFAQQADLSLVCDAAPPGTFNYTDDREYTPAQAIDLLNSVLLTKGYTLIRRDRMLMVLNLKDGIPPNLVSIVPAEELEKRGEFELVSVLFPLQRLSPEEAEQEVQKLLGPQGSVVVLSKSRHIQVTETAGRLRTIRRVIEALESPLGHGGQVKIFPLKYITPDEALPVLRQLLDVPTDKNAALDGSLRFMGDTPGRRILASGRPDKLARIGEVLDTLDVATPGGELANSKLDTTPQLEIYPIVGVSPDSAFQVIQTLLTGMPDVRLSLDAKSGNLIALARPSQQATIRATLEQFQRDARRVEVYQLQFVDPQVAVAAIGKLFSTGPDSGALAPTVDANPASRQLFIRASESQLTQIKSLLQKMGETGMADPGYTDQRNVRVLPLTGRMARSALERIQEIWPTMHPNKIQVVTPLAPISSVRPADSSETDSAPTPTTHPGPESLREGPPGPTGMREGRPFGPPRMPSHDRMPHGPPDGRLPQPATGQSPAARPGVPPVTSDPADPAKPLPQAAPQSPAKTPNGTPPPATPKSAHAPVPATDRSSVFHFAAQVQPKPAETQPAQAKPAEVKPAPAKPAEAKPVEPKPATQPAKVIAPSASSPKALPQATVAAPATPPKPAEVKPVPAKPAEAKAVEPKPAMQPAKVVAPSASPPKALPQATVAAPATPPKPAEVKPVPAKPAEAKAVEPKPAMQPAKVVAPSASPPKALPQATVAAPATPPKPAEVKPVPAKPAEPPVQVAKPVEPQPKSLSRPEVAAPRVRSQSEPAPIIVSQGPGGLMIASQDVEALNAFERLLSTLASGQSTGGREMTVFYLKHAKAVAVAETLEQVLAGGFGGGGRSSGGFPGGPPGRPTAVPSGGSSSLLTSGGYTPSGPVQITPDARLNALVVNANPVDVDTIEELLKILDQKGSPEDILTEPKPRLIPVFNTQAEEVAQVVRQVYQDRMVTGSSSGFPPGPGGFIMAMQQAQQMAQQQGGQRGSRRSRGSSQQREDTPKMSIGVDPRTNSLIVSAPEALFEEVRQLVEQLDQGATESNQVLRVVTLQRSSPTAIEQALSSLMGQSVQIGRTSSSSFGSSSFGMPMSGQLGQRRGFRSGGGFSGFQGYQPGFQSRYQMGFQQGYPSPFGQSRSQSGSSGFQYRQQRNGQSGFSPGQRSYRPSSSGGPSRSGR